MSTWYDPTEYVYVLTHLPTGKKYVGRTRHPKMRGQQHITAAKRGKHPCKALQADYNKYGGEFSYEVIGECPRERGFDREKQLMVQLKTYDEKFGYNTNDWAMNPIRKRQGLSFKKGNNKHTKAKSVFAPS